MSHRKSTKIASVCIIAAMVLVSCQQETNTPSQLQLDAAHSVALNGTISAGNIVTRYKDTGSIEREIREQLFYTIGQFNGEQGVGDMNRLEVSVSSVEAIEETEFYTAQYAASLLIAWPRERQFPQSYDLILPKRGDWSHLSTFYATYGEDCLDRAAHDVSVGIFWYYYRPQNCTIDADGDPDLVVSFPIQLQLSDENTSGKSPEYGKIWEDGALVVTAIFGKAEDGATESWDAGISAYNETYRSVLSQFGQPDEIEPKLKRRQVPGIDHPDVTLTYVLQDDRELKIHLTLVDGIRSVDAEFRETYNQRTLVSDLITYSGHSGLGANIRALAGMGKFATGKYQIFLINGCDTFSYVDNSLTEAHAEVNPGYAGTKYIDLITNAMPSYFHMNAESNLALLKALVEQRRTYRQILAEFDRNQRAVVTGEEDNRWPLPFYENPLEEIESITVGGVNRGELSAAGSSGDQAFLKLAVAEHSAYEIAMVGFGENFDLYGDIDRMPSTESYRVASVGPDARERIVVEAEAGSEIVVLVKATEGIGGKFYLRVRKLELADPNE